MSPGHKRQIAEELVSGGRCSGRAACRHFGLHRSTFAYEAKQPDAWLARLKAALRRVSNQHPEMGYPKITKLLKDEGWRVDTRIVQRLRRELGLTVPAKKPKKRRRGSSTGLPTKATHRGHVWTWDFVHDTTVRGGKLRMLNVIDEFTRECLCIYVDRRINARKVRRIISELIDIHGAPEHIRSDNGSEFIETSFAIHSSILKEDPIQNAADIQEQATLLPWVLLTNRTSKGRTHLCVFTRFEI
jgi:transposase InsO family protein